MSDPGEAYFCGKCRRQQGTQQGDACIICERITVSWYTKDENEAAASKKWKTANP
jgi:hypothetical protein